MEQVKVIREKIEYWVRFVGPRRVVAGAMVAAALGVLAVFMFMPSGPPAELSIPVARTGTLVSAPGSVPAQVTTVPFTVRVHVAGAVRRPGVYGLRSTDRVVDAVRAAGGATVGADLESINLAQTILDTEQIYVPHRSSRVAGKKPAPRLRPKRLSPTTLPASQSAPATGAPATTVLARVNINTATAAQLDSLPGVGPSTAKAIIAYRQSKGPYSKVDDLLNVPGIGPSKLEAMRGMIQA